MDNSDTVTRITGTINKNGVTRAMRNCHSDFTNQQISNGHACDAALKAITSLHAPALPVIDYISRGHIVIFGEIDKHRSSIEQLAALHRQGLVIDTVIDPTGNKSTFDSLNIPVVCARVAEVCGHLGAFEIVVQSAGGRFVPLTEFVENMNNSVDIVIDFLDSPCLDAEVLPPGYFYAGQASTDQKPVNITTVEQLLEDLPDMLGEFDKPRYFSYNPNICVHGRAGKTACDRCIDACPTLAITSLAESIEVDPYLCQGGGSCAAACPSGAIRYAYPSLEHVLTIIKTLLTTYRDHHGTHPRLVFYESAGVGVIEQAFTDPACNNILPLMMEEIGAVGMEITLAALAYGAQQVIISYSDTTPPRIKNTLQQQVELANIFLRAMDYSGQAIMLCSIHALDAVTTTDVTAMATDQRSPAHFMAFDDKRTMIYRALEHLNQIAPNPQQVLLLPEQAPFGRVHVDRNACTLCFACASVCPMQALQAGGEQPRLNFIEDNCVHCGLCEQSCPEQAISLESRFVFSPTQRKHVSVLNEEEPFACIRCGKPFTTRRMLDHMTNKLADHWMFKDPNAMARLKMCENCRVEDIYVTHEKMH